MNANATLLAGFDALVRCGASVRCGANVSSVRARLDYEKPQIVGLAFRALLEYVTPCILRGRLLETPWRGTRTMQCTP